ncbi:MAG: hypothetical protein KC910_21370 [Candidatus Eremiobacteraeota bacterium]|nr:hypothetical protein [Candidatus Eremiobacteraeota bacterium]
MRRGFTLLEAVLGIGLLALLSLAVFGLFRLGSDHFRIGVMRNDLQAQGRRAIALLQREFPRSSYASLGIFTSGLNPPRDAISFATLSDWNDPALFDPASGRPEWDRYYFFFCTTDLPLGRLGYAVIDPGAEADTPWANMTAHTPVVAPPSVGAEITRVTMLADSVERFQVTDNSDSVSFDLVLSGQSLDVHRRQERYEFTFTIKPINS